MFFYCSKTFPSVNCVVPLLLEPKSQWFDSDSPHRTTWMTKMNLHWHFELLFHHCCCQNIMHVLSQGTCWGVITGCCPNLLHMGPNKSSREAPSSQCACLLNKSIRTLLNMSSLRCAANLVQVLNYSFQLMFLSLFFHTGEVRNNNEEDGEVKLGVCVSISFGLEFRDVFICAWIISLYFPALLVFSFCTSFNPVRLK